MEAIDSDQQRRDRQHRDLEILSEAFGRFVRLWAVVHASTFSDPTTPAAADALSKQLAAGENLYGRFAATTAQHFAKGHRFIHDLPKVERKPAQSAVLSHEQGGLGDRLRRICSADGQSALPDTAVLNAHDRTFVKEVFKTWENTIEDSIHVLDSGQREPQ